MVGRSYSLNMSGVESTDIRIALYEMNEDVQRLQEELDAEREASSTSASEAMSMILRLQGEKAALVMEASQYKRMVEERMSHAELSLDLLEDLNYQKEVEIKNLECELDAYRSKLMSLGCSGIDGDHLTDDGMRCWDRSQTPSPEPVDTDLLVPVEKGVIEQSLDSSRRDQEKIKKLDEQLKELMDFRDSVKEKFKNLKQETFSVPESKNGEKGEAFAGSSSSNIQDIVEVVQTKERTMSKKSYKQKRDTSIKRDHARRSCSAIEAEYQAELMRLKERVERLEWERFSGGGSQTSEVYQEKMNLQRKSEEESQTSGVNQEKMNLQRKSEEESNSVQSEMKTSRAIIDVQEAMLYFWL